MLTIEVGKPEAHIMVMESYTKPASESRERWLRCRSPDKKSRPPTIAVTLDSCYKEILCIFGFAKSTFSTCSSWWHDTCRASTCEANK